MPPVTLPRYPERPPARGQPPRPKPKKKKKLVAPKGYLGGWRTNPGLNKKKFKTIKTGQGYYIAKKLTPKVPTPKGGKATVPKVPAPPKGPYDEYPSWARQSLLNIDADTQREQQFGLEVQKWLSGTLAPIQAAGQAASQNYRQSMAAIPGGVGTPGVLGTGGTGTTLGSPDAWKANAAQAAQSGYSQIAQGQGAIESFLNDAKIGNLRSALETNFAQDLLRLGEQRKREKTEYMAKLDQFMAESEQEAAQAQAELAQKTTNDWYDFVAQLTNAGVRLTDINLDASQPPSGSGGIFIPGQQKPPDVPGKQWVKEPGGWRAVDLPSAPKPTATPKPTGLIGPIDPGTPTPRGYVKVRSGGKIYWRAKGTTTGGGSTTGGRGKVTPEQRRIQFKESSDIWKGKPANSILGTGAEPGVKDAPVNRFTSPDGTIPPGTPGPRRSYIFYVRAYRLREQVLAMTEDKKRTDTILKGLLGSRNFARFNTWRLNQGDRGDLSFYAAKRRRHV